MSRFVKPKAPPTKEQVWLKKWIGTPIRGTINPALKEPIAKRKKASGPKLEPVTPADQEKITRKLQSFEEELAKELSGQVKTFRGSKKRKKSSKSKLSRADLIELKKELGGRKRAKP